MAAATLFAMVVVAVAAFYRLGDLPYRISLSAAMAGVAGVLPTTAWAALKVWTLWGWSSLVIAALILKIDPALGLCDAILTGFSGLIVLAYVLGHLLGPIGLFRAPVIWALLAVGTLWLWRRGPRIAWRAPSEGQKLTLLAVAILAIVILPCQLGSPVVPVADALCWPASAQRILTFHVYAPFDNFPYGRWGRFQASAFEPFYASLAMSTHTGLAVLAESAAMFPIGALLLLATYRLGRALLGDVGGGIAALLLFLTTMVAREPSVRPSVADFVLVGIGLGFFLDSRRNRTRAAIGALLLGVSIPADVIHGAFAIAIAAVATSLFLATGEEDVRSFKARLACLAGALLVGAAEFPIALHLPLPYPILPLSQLAGLGVIMMAARPIPQHTEPRRARIEELAVATVIAVLVAMIFGDSAGSASRLWQVLYATFPVLTIIGVGGLMLYCARPLLGRAELTSGAGLVAFAIFVAATALGEQWTAPHLSSIFVLTAYWHFSHKLLEYWWPYTLLLAAALPLSLLYRWSRPAAMVVLTAMLLVPWRVTQPPASDNERRSFFKHAFNLHLANDQSSLMEQMAYSFHIAADGGWVAHPDTRWVFGPAEFDLLKSLDTEISAGRITMDTHILHVTDKCVYPHFAQVSVFSGINDDPIEYLYDPNNIFARGGRGRGIGDFASLAARKPPYILYEVAPEPGMQQYLKEYDEIFHEDDHRLFRRRDLAPRARAD